MERQASDLRERPPSFWSMASSLSSLKLSAPDLPYRIGILLAWVALTLVLAQHHVFWRDEVRAFSVALAGDNILDMLRRLHGEGHPAVWYLLLRVAHDLVGRVEVLPSVAWLVGFAGVALFVLRAPFRWPMLALFALGNVAAYEYAVMARNYGISMLLIFAYAALYSRSRRNGLLLGLILLLLANTNVHSVLLAGGFGFFWLIDLLREQGLRRTAALGHFLIAATLMGIGVIACALTVYPTVNDAAVMEHTFFSGILLQLTVEPFLRVLGPVPGYLLLALIVPLSLAIIGSIWELPRSTGAFPIALATLTGFILLFSTIYPGDLRHEALWLVFVFALYWIENARRPLGASSSSAGRQAGAAIPRGISQLSLGIVLACQVPTILLQLHDSLGDMPESRSRDFAAFLSARPQYAQATLIADPDFLLEPLRYYLPNRTYLMREHRFGSRVIFSKTSQKSLSLDQILDNAAELRRADGKPVVILLKKELDKPSPLTIEREGYDWQLVALPDQVDRFLAHTRLLGRFRPAQTNEAFDAYEYLDEPEPKTD
jgi:hypothetical protein